MILVAVLSTVAACDSARTTGNGSIERDTVTFMTYNIFHDGERADHGIRPWPERRDAIVEILRDEAADVVGLQEAEVWQVDWLLEQLPEYAAVARGPFEDPDVPDAETVAILYREDRYGLKASGHFWFSDSPDTPGSDGSSFGGLTRPRIVTWVRLRRGGSTASRGFYVFNTHFAADGAAADPETARFKSAELLARRIADRPHQDEHFVVTGDLNVAPGEWPLRYLLGSRCDSDAACAETAASEVRMIDTWAARHPEEDDAGTRCNSVTGTDGPRVDYVLAWDPAHAGSCDGGSCDSPPILDADIIHREGECPSDHRPVVATLILPIGPL